MRKAPGTLRAIRWRFAWWPRWTDDSGRVWLTGYQELVIEHAHGLLEQRRVAHFLNKVSPAADLPAAATGDGCIYFEFRPWPRRTLRERLRALNAAARKPPSRHGAPA